MIDLKKLSKVGKKMGLYNPQDIVLLIVLTLYIICDVNTPKLISDKVSSTTGKFLVIALSIIVFLKANNVVGILALISGYMLIKRSVKDIPQQYKLPSEKEKWSQFEKYNDFPVTLEEEMVSKLAPLVEPSQNDQADVEYSPVLTDLHDAAGTDYSGVN